HCLRWTGWLWRRSRAAALIASKQSRVGTARNVGEVWIDGVRPAAGRRRGDVDQACAWVIRHRRPVVTTARTGLHRDGFVVMIVMCFGINDRPPRFLINAFRPSDGCKRLGRNE